MTEPSPPSAEALGQQLIRNLHDAPRRPFQRPPLYNSMYAPLSDGAAARYPLRRGMPAPPGGGWRSGSGWP